MAYRRLATTTGWAVGTVSEYFTGNALPPTDRFDVLVQLLGATATEQGALATFRDLVEERQRPRPAEPLASGARPASMVPRQLPAPPMPFVGRMSELATLTALADQDTTAAITPAIAAIVGPAGVGKTALALSWAHKAADRFPDGQLYVNLRGFDPTGTPVRPMAAVGRVLEALRVTSARVPDDLDARSALYRGLLAGRRMLIVLDNARDAAQVRPLLPATAGCLTVVTSRNRLTPLVALDSVHPMTLDLLDPRESRALLAQRLGADRVSAEPSAVAEVVTACDRLPLALAIVAARAKATGFPMSAISAELARGPNRLDALNAGDAFTDVRAVVSWSYRTLSPSAARLFRLLGLDQRPEITLSAAASLAGVPAPEARRLLAELADVSLLVELDSGRYRLPGLLRAFVAGLVDRVEAIQVSHDALARLCSPRPTRSPRPNRPPLACSRTEIVGEPRSR